jgi:hypothetical protein
MQAAGACSCLQVMGIVAGKPFKTNLTNVPSFTWLHGIRWCYPMERCVILMT